MKSNFNINIPQCIHGISISYECSKCLIINTKIPTLKEINDLKVEVFNTLNDFQKKLKSLETKQKKVPKFVSEHQEDIKNIKLHSIENRAKLVKIESFVNSLEDCFKSLNHKLNIFLNDKDGIAYLLEDAKGAKARFESALSKIRDRDNKREEVINALCQKISILENMIRQLTNKEAE